MLSVAFFIVILSVIMMSVVMLRVVMMSVVALSLWLRLNKLERLSLASHTLT